MYDLGVLHRDISEGNILIRSSGSEREEGRMDRGMLIDLDHAKHTEMTTEDHMGKTFNEDDIEYMKNHIRYEEHELTDEVYKKALRFFDRKRALAYLEHKMDNLPESLEECGEQ